MNDQWVILAMLVLSLVSILGLAILRAKKQMAYRNDERWKAVQVAAGKAAQIADLLLLLAILVGSRLDETILIPLGRIILFAEIFLGLRCLIELGALIYYDRKF